MNSLTQEQKDKVKLHMADTNTLFEHLNNQIQLLNESQPEFMDNCYHNIVHAQNVMLIAMHLREANRAIMKTITGEQE